MRGQSTQTTHRSVFQRILRWEIKAHHWICRLSKHAKQTKGNPFYKTSEFWGTFSTAFAAYFSGVGFDMANQSIPAGIVVSLFLISMVFGALAWWCAVRSLNPFLRILSTIVVTLLLALFIQKSYNAMHKEVVASVSPTQPSGQLFPLLKELYRPYQYKSNCSNYGNLRHRVLDIADEIDKYKLDYPRPNGPEREMSKWYSDRSEYFRSNTLGSVIKIHDELTCFHIADSDLDFLLEIESYKEQINENGGLSDDFLLNPLSNAPRHPVIMSSDDIDKIAVRLRAIAAQIP